MSDKDNKLQRLKRLADERRAMRKSVERQVREEIALRLDAQSRKVDIAAREAFDAGATITDLRRATGNKDYATARAMLARTQDIAVHPSQKFQMAQSEDGVETLTVTDRGHTAQFEVEKWDDGTLFFGSTTPRYNDDEELNPLVAELDGNVEGDLYEEAVRFWRGEG